MENILKEVEQSNGNLKVCDSKKECILSKCHAKLCVIY